MMYTLESVDWYFSKENLPVKKFFLRATKLCQIQHKDSLDTQKKL